MSYLHLLFVVPAALYLYYANPLDLPSPPPPPDPPEVETEEPEQDQSGEEEKLLQARRCKRLLDPEIADNGEPSVFRFRKRYDIIRGKDLSEPLKLEQARCKERAGKPLTIEQIDLLNKHDTEELKKKAGPPQLTMRDSSRSETNDQANYYHMW